MLLQCGDPNSFLDKRGKRHDFEDGFWSYSPKGIFSKRRIIEIVKRNANFIRLNAEREKKLPGSQGSF